jgi:RND family efflux transporter MFP subunit
MRPLAALVTAPGSVVSLNDGRIASETGGRLLWVAQPGETVERGQPLARLDETSLKLRLRENDATIGRLAAALKFQEQQVARFRELAGQHIAARNQLEEAVATADMTRHELEQARVAREQTAYLLARAVVAAPFSGQVVERYRQEGEFVAEGGELVRLVDTKNMEARIQAPMLVAPYLEPGVEITVADRDERRVTARIRAVIPVADQRSRLMEVRASLPVESWPIGSAVRAELPGSRKENVLAIPRDALILRRDVAYVYRVKSDNTVERVEVERGRGNGTFIGISGDLQPGDHVVVRGGETLKPGQRVAVSAAQDAEAHVARDLRPESRG